MRLSLGLVTWTIKKFPGPLNFFTSKFAVTVSVNSVSYDDVITRNIVVAVYDYDVQ